MRIFVKRGVGLGILLAAAALLAAASSSAGSRAAGTSVPCDPTALTTAFTTANTSGGTLKLASNCVYLLPAALPTVTGNIVLLGGKYTTITRTNAAPAFRLFDVASGASLQLSSLTLLNGNIAGNGGAVQTAGTLTVKKVVFGKNTAQNGGAIAVLGTGTATISSSSFTANSATVVGGGAIVNLGTLTVSNSAMTGNSAPSDGGAINTQASGHTSVSGGTYSLNTAGSLGGALSNNGGTTVIKGAKLLSNMAANGGALATGGGTVTILSASMRGNVPNNCPASSIPNCVN